MLIFSACRHLYHCRNALEYELAAIREGLLLALQWSELPIVIESDCLEATNLTSGSPSKPVEYSRATVSHWLHVNFMDACIFACRVGQHTDLGNLETFGW